MCAHPGCRSLAMMGLADGLCQSHHRRRIAGKDMDKPLKRAATGECTQSGCTRPQYATGLCVMHYSRRLRGAAMDEPPHHEKGLRRVGVDECNIAGCTRTVRGRGMCGMHYQRWREAGDPGPASPLKAANGSGHLNKDGYREIRVDGNRSVGEHRYVMEQIIGRALYRYEHVHHRNGIRSDNRPANLELWVKGHPFGQRPEDLVAFVVEFYPDAVRAALEGEPRALWLPTPEPE